MHEARYEARCNSAPQARCRTAPMLYCRCGFTCGTERALDRHMSQFAGTAEAASHAKKAQISFDLEILESCEDGQAADYTDDDRTPPTTAWTPLAQPPCRPFSPESWGQTTPLRGRRSLALMQPSPRTECNGLEVRLLLVRHAQSANKARDPGSPASLDPGLTELGMGQAESLSRRLLRHFRPEHFEEGGGAMIATSPMRRCLLTIRPTIRRLKLGPEHCVVHGGCYEYGCAGIRHRGTPLTQIIDEFPEFHPLGFQKQGDWDYRGDNDKESGPEAIERAVRVVQWLRAMGATLNAENATGETCTLILVTHQTIADLLCHLLVEGRADRWRYGEVRYKIQNASLTEIFFDPRGRARFGARSDNSHLLTLGDRDCR